VHELWVSVLELSNKALAATDQPILGVPYGFYSSSWGGNHSPRCLYSFNEVFRLIAERFDRYPETIAGFGTRLEGEWYQAFISNELEHDTDLPIDVATS
jgi:hypothetical protein